MPESLSRSDLIDTKTSWPKYLLHLKDNRKAHTFLLPSGKRIKGHGCELRLVCTLILLPRPTVQTLPLGAFKRFTNFTCKIETLSHFTDGKTEVSNLPDASEQSSCWAQNRTKTDIWLLLVWGTSSPPQRSPRQRCFHRRPRTPTPAPLTASSSWETHANYQGTKWPSWC